MSMYVKECEVDFDMYRNRISFEINTESEGSISSCSLNDIMRRVNIFKRKFNKYEPKWKKESFESGDFAKSVSWNYNYEMYEGDENELDSLDLCDMDMIYSKDDTKMYVDASFEYRVADEEDLHSYYKMLNLFCRYCLGVDISKSRVVDDELKFVWPEVIDYLDRDRENLEGMLEKIISENSFASEMSGHYPMVLYDEFTGGDNLKKKVIVEDVDLYVSFLNLYLKSL